MAGLIHCTGQLAIRPFNIVKSGVYVYSLEELSYYISNNVYTIDDSIMSEKLCSWVAEELHLPELSRKLFESMKGFSSLSAFAGILLSSCGYCDEADIERIKNVLDQVGNKNEFFRRKTKADTLLSEKRYTAAVNDYKKLLSFYETKKEPDDNVGAVWHNMGTAYAGLFLFSEAADCYEKAFNLNNEPETFSQYKYALYMIHNTAYYKHDRMIHVSTEDLVAAGEDIAKVLDEGNNTTRGRLIGEISEAAEYGDLSEYRREIEDITEDWKKDCRQAVR
ncbi:MAG: tetratricopeptide repeat protein [Lachnospiraceae bacterium]|nr:tetratricopeptide repeat protein [Lachnospiraceae bacterium]